MNGPIDLTMHLHPTETLVRLRGGEMARVWAGTTGGGIPILVVVAGLAVDESHAGTLSEAPLIRLDPRSIERFAPAVAELYDRAQDEGWLIHEPEDKATP